MTVLPTWEQLHTCGGQQVTQQAIARSAQHLGQSDRQSLGHKDMCVVPVQINTAHTSYNGCTSAGDQAKHSQNKSTIEDGGMKHETNKQ